MREILFRGKSLDTGAWVYGYLAKLKWYYDDSDKTIIIPEYGGLYPHCEISEYEFVDPETVGQWTGLVDKNGVKIFEGDVVGGDKTISNYVYDLYTHTGKTVTLTNKDLKYVVEFTPSSLTLAQYNIRKGLTVIGNKWEVENV